MASKAKTRTFQTVINDRTLEETAPSVNTSFPYRTDIDDLSTEPGGVFPWHWHSEVEIFYMQEGSLSYRIPGKECLFEPGDIGFINTNVPHLTIGVGPPPCLQQEHIFLSRLVGGQPGDAIEETYVLPLLRNTAADLIRIPADDPAAAFLREQMDRAFSLFYGSEPGREIRIRTCMSEVWLEIARRAAAFVPVPNQGDSQRIKAMLQYIDRHFDEAVRLPDIAAAAQVGVREASRVFQRQLNMTAFEYLLDLRVNRACSMLRSSTLSVTEIATRCGFSSPSYFGKIFRERMKMSPSDYRKRIAEGNADNKIS